MTTREDQKKQREEEILMMALHLFTSKGYASTKTSDISKALHISEGLLFHYFKSKESLLETLVDIATQTNTSWIEPKPLEPLAYFTSVADGVLTLLREEKIGADFFVLIAQLKQNEGIPEHIRQKVIPDEHKMDPMLAIVRKGQRQGVIRKGDPRALLYLFSNTLNAIAIGYATIPDMPLPETEWIIAMLKQSPIGGAE